MTGRDGISLALLAVLAVLLAVLLANVWQEVAECEAKGGKRLRGTISMLEGYKCYDARTLKVLP